MGRPNAVWYRASRDEWFTTIDGKQVRLKVKGRDNREAAEAARRKLIDPPAASDPSAASSDDEELARRILDRPLYLHLDFGKGIPLYGKTAPSIGDHIGVPKEVAPGGKSVTLEVVGRKWTVSRGAAGRAVGILLPGILLSVKQVDEKRE